MSKDKQLISVIFPFYNAEQFLEVSIKSILNQTYKNFELILINDGSTDRSLEICKNFKKKDNRIVILNKLHEGLTKALNFGIKNSNGFYIARQDADDISKESRLLIQKKFLENSNAIMCGTNCEIIKNNKKKKNWSIEFTHKKIINKLEYSNCFVHSSIMFKKEIAEKVNFYDENLIYAQDYDLWWKLSLVGKVRNLEDKLVLINQHNQSISKVKQNEQTLCFINSAVKYFYFKKVYKNNHFNNFSEMPSMKNNKRCINQKNILMFLYKDKLEKKVNFKSLSLREKFLILNYPTLLIRKLIKG